MFKRSLLFWKLYVARKVLFTYLDDANKSAAAREKKTAREWEDIQHWEYGDQEPIKEGFQFIYPVIYGQFQLYVGQNDSNQQMCSGF
jgi:hypothetical protein